MLCDVERKNKGECPLESERNPELEPTPELDRATTYGDHALWFRAVYGPMIRERTMTAAPRRGDRTKDQTLPTYLPQGVPIPVRIIFRPGFQAASIAAVFEPDDGTTVVITDAVVKRIDELTDEDLKGCAPDCATPELLRWHLGLIDNRPPADYDEVVTIWRWHYTSLEDWWAYTGHE